MMTKDFLLITLDLINEDHISVFDTPDRLRVNIYDKKFFMA